MSRAQPTAETLPLKKGKTESPANWSVRVLRAWEAMGYPELLPGIEAEQVKLALEIQNRLGFAPKADSILHPPHEPPKPFM